MKARIRFLVDEDFDNDILRGLLRRIPSLDIVRVQDLGLGGGSDPEVLARAASEGRIVLTHDVNSLLAHATARLRAGSRMSGVVAVAQSVTVGRAIEDLVLLVECSQEGEWEGWVLFLPL